MTVSVNFSAKTEYACIAVLELAMHYGSDKPVRVRDIAQANGIPARFLVQILLQLKGAGIVQQHAGIRWGLSPGPRPGRCVARRRDGHQRRNDVRTGHECLQGERRFADVAAGLARRSPGRA